MSANGRKTGSTKHGVVDVSEVPADCVQEFVQDSAEVYLERKGGRTFLIPE